MRLPSEVLIVSTSPIFSRALRQFLEEGPDATRCWIHDESSPPGPSAADPDVVLIAPCHWEEMARWLLPLRRQFYVPAWLMLADLRVAGMFSSYLEMHRAGVLPASASPHELRERVCLLTGQQSSYPIADLLSVFHRNAPFLPSRRPPCLLTPRELQCGCAVSLGLSNRQIAELLYLGEATVKSHVHHLLEKLELSNREDLGAYIERALTPASTPLWWSEIQPKVWK